MSLPMSANPADALPIVADDHRIIVINKPVGLTSEDTARLLGRRLVHRIDRATSGLLLLADDARTVQRMQRLLSTAQVTRTYLALVRGTAAPGVVERSLVPDRGDGRRGSVAPGTDVPAKSARTCVDVLAACSHASLVAAHLVTGRTHQVRIHLADIGHPIFGDHVYGAHDATAPRLMLHAWRLAFVHPNTHAPVEFEAPPSAAFSAVVESVLGSMPLLPVRQVGDERGSLSS